MRYTTAEVWEVEVLNMPGWLINGSEYNCSNPKSVQTVHIPANNCSYWIWDGYRPIHKYEPVES